MTITMKDFMEITNKRITHVDKFQWKCFGDKAFYFDCYEEKNSYFLSIVYDILNNTVYQFEVSDYENRHYYKWTNPIYREAHNEEEKIRESKGMIFVDCPFTEIEEESDILKKAKAIVNGEEYDTRVSIPIDLDDETLLILMKNAHEKDITFNEYVGTLISEFILKNKVVTAYKNPTKTKEIG